MGGADCRRWTMLTLWRWDAVVPSFSMTLSNTIDVQYVSTYLSDFQSHIASFEWSGQNSLSCPVSAKVWRCNHVIRMTEWHHLTSIHYDYWFVCSYVWFFMFELFSHVFTIFCFMVFLLSAHLKCTLQGGRSSGWWRSAPLGGSLAKNFTWFLNSSQLSRSSWNWLWQSLDSIS